ncbi:16S rRNA (guanine(527)-N(7))-methyltransferase RsmG [Gammaproteobacteria bacterium]|nr:16S rRNA (guanine(527)-N(7))-methyltransferase RsmG [Gammaproteobacteria bacterium]
MNTPKEAQTLTSQYVDEILIFNKAHNIVGRSSKQEILELDIKDAETILEHTKDQIKILDIGSGAGLPGIIIAINQPWSQVVMSEKSKKKAYFLKKTIKTLGLKNAEVIDTAITTTTKNLEPFDVITARALASSNNIVNMSEQLLAPNGVFLLMKGRKEAVTSEVNDLDNTKYSYTIHSKRLPKTQRHILEIKKK